MRVQQSAGAAERVEKPAQYILDARNREWMAAIGGGCIHLVRHSPLDTLSILLLPDLQQSRTRELSTAHPGFTLIQIFPCRPATPILVFHISFLDDFSFHTRLLEDGDHAKCRASLRSRRVESCGITENQLLPHLPFPTGGNWGYEANFGTMSSCGLLYTVGGEACVGGMQRRYPFLAAIAIGLLLLPLLLLLHLHIYHLLLIDINLCVVPSILALLNGWARLGIHRTAAIGRDRSFDGRRWGRVAEARTREHWGPRQTRMRGGKISGSTCRWWDQWGGRFKDLPRVQARRGGRLGVDRTLVLDLFPGSRTGAAKDAETSVVLSTWSCHCVGTDIEAFDVPANAVAGGPEFSLHGLRYPSRIRSSAFSVRWWISASCDRRGRWVVPLRPRRRRHSDELDWVVVCSRHGIAWWIAWPERRKGHAELSIVHVNQSHEMAQMNVWHRWVDGTDQWMARMSEMAQINGWSEETDDI